MLQHPKISTNRDIVPFPAMTTRNCKTVTIKIYKGYSFVQMLIEQLTQWVRILKVDGEHAPPPLGSSKVFVK